MKKTVHTNLTVIPAWIAGIQKPGMAGTEYILVVWMSAIPADMTT
ncbi:MULTISPECIES: hypothetical protein [Methylococcaceae]|nr:hypothetical protein [Methylomarinum vadi]